MERRTILAEFLPQNLLHLSAITALARGTLEGLKRILVSWTVMPVAFVANSLAIRVVSP